MYFVHLHLVLRELYSPIRLNPRRFDVVFVQLFVDTIFAECTVEGGACSFSPSRLG